MVVERFPLWCLFVVCLLFRVQDQWIDTPDTCGSIIEDYGRLEHSWYSVANDAIQIRFKCFELEHCTIDNIPNMLGRYIIYDCTRSILNCPVSSS